MWGSHGTKIIGTAGAVVTALSTIDPTVLQSLFGANAQNYIMGALSLLTILRGFQSNPLNGKQPESK